MHFTTGQCSLWLWRKYFFTSSALLLLVCLLRIIKVAFRIITMVHSGWQLNHSLSLPSKLLVEDKNVESRMGNHFYKLSNCPLMLFFFSEIADIQLSDLWFWTFGSTYQHLSSSWRACYTWISLVGGWGSVNVFLSVASSFHNYPIELLLCFPMELFLKNARCS